MSIQVHLQQFEGPLALLLYLIRKNEMDIYNIQIHKITREYLEYIKVMKRLDLEVAGDFVAMAATLIQIKSKMLLPLEEGTAEDIEDPRKPLIQKLLEYQRASQVGKWLNLRALLGRDVWKRTQKLEVFDEIDETIEIDERGLFTLIGMYRAVIKQVRKKVHVVVMETQSIKTRVLELKNLFIPGRNLEMQDLYQKEERTRSKIVITFLSILELARLGFISIFQNETYGPIHIETKKAIIDDVVSQVDEFNAEPQLAHTTSVYTKTVDAATDDDILTAEQKVESDIEKEVSI